jgi:hypothetical protein
MRWKLNDNINVTLGMEIMKYTLENIFHFEVRVLKKIIYI